VIAQIPSGMLYEKLNRSTAMIQMLHGDRFLSIADWRTKSLQIFDLRTKSRLLPDGNTVLQFVSEGNLGTMRCDVEFVEDRFLVLFTKNITIKNLQEPIVENANTVRRGYSQVPDVQGHPIDEGEMMLFDSAGKPCWENPVKVEKIYRLQEMPDCLPVMLFAVYVNERYGTTTLYSTRIMGVDKRSGEFRFRKFFTQENIDLRSFRVNADPLMQEIIFTTQNSTPPRVVKATFTGKPVVKEGE